MLRTKWDALAERWHRLLRAYHFLPDLERPRSQYPVVDRLDQVAAETKEILSESMQHQKPLSLSRRRKSAHMIFLLPCRLMRHFRSIVGIDMIDVCDGRHDRAVSGIIAFEFVGYHPARLTSLAFQ